MIKQKKLERLKMHLLKLEEATGAPLYLPSVRGASSKCPIAHYAPRKDKRGNIYRGVRASGTVVYLDKNFKSFPIRYKIYTWRDSIWWQELAYVENHEYHQAIRKWLRERSK